MARQPGRAQLGRLGLKAGPSPSVPSRGRRLTVVYVNVMLVSSLIIVRAMGSGMWVCLPWGHVGAFFWVSIPLIIWWRIIIRVASQTSILGWWSGACRSRPNLWCWVAGGGSLKKKKKNTCKQLYVQFQGNQTFEGWPQDKREQVSFKTFRLVVLYHFC
jgi:hypothetical protein